ncbi:hypothetical protein QQ045_010301 [Rhodiola kirilowii]
MFLKAQLHWNVIIPPDKLDAKGLMLQRSIIIRLLEEFANKKATKDLGYLTALTTLEKIGDAKVRQNTGEVVFPVDFSCITFKLFRGEIVEAEAEKILKHGIILKCGPVECYISHQKMSGYHYVPGENPVFMSDKLGKIEKGVTLRVVVFGTKWIEAERKFMALVSLDGDFLGPV